MNVKDFIKNIQKMPTAFVHEVRLDYLEYVIEGFICCNSMYDRADNEERCFHCYFVDWIVGWINQNIDNKYERKSSLWHQILRDVTNDEQEAVALFFDYVIYFLNNMKKIILNKGLYCIYL